MEIKVVEKEISLAEIKEIAIHQFGDLVKFVIDIEKEIIAIGGDLHADEEAILIQSGSEQKDLWGINFYPEKEKIGKIEFDSVINLRPSSGNRSRDVEDPKIREKIVNIVDKLVVK
jgi:hypothetical protein